jgi:hypothetical protein
VALSTPYSLLGSLQMSQVAGPLESQVEQLGSSQGTQAPSSRVKPSLQSSHLLASAGQKAQPLEAHCRAHEGDRKGDSALGVEQRGGCSQHCTAVLLRDSMRNGWLQCAGHVQLTSTHCPVAVSREKARSELGPPTGRHCSHVSAELQRSQLAGHCRGGRSGGAGRGTQDRIWRGACTHHNSAHAALCACACCAVRTAPFTFSRILKWQGAS